MFQPNMNKVKYECPRSYSKSVTTRIGQSFLHLIDPHFPKNHTLKNIFNRNKVKVSYTYLVSVY